MPVSAPASRVADPAAPRRSRAGLWLRLFLLLATLYNVADMGLLKPMTMFGIDYQKHWDAARAILEGHSPYNGGDLWLRFNYPQFSALAFCWLGFFPAGMGERVWKLTLLVFVVGCWVVAWRWYRPRRPCSGGLSSADFEARRGAWSAWGLLTAFAVASYLPATSCILLGNGDPVSALLAVAMGAAVLAGAPVAAGMLLALMVLVKLVPLALLAPVVLWRRWRILKGFVGAMVVYVLVLALTGRLATEWYFFHEALPAVARWWRNISISPLRLGMNLAGLKALYDNPYGFEAASRIWLVVMGLGYLGLMLWLWRRRAPFVRALEVAMVVYPLLSPLIEYRHFVWILPVLLLQLRRWSAGRMSTPMGVGLLLGWCLLNVGYYSGNLLRLCGDYAHFASLPGYLVIVALTIVDARGAMQSRARVGHET